MGRPIVSTIDAESKVVLAKAKVADLLQLNVKRMEVWGAAEKEAPGAKKKKGGRRATRLDVGGRGEAAELTRQLLHNGHFEESAGSGQEFWRVVEGATAVDFAMSEPRAVAESAAMATRRTFGLGHDGGTIDQVGSNALEYDETVAHSGRRSLRLPGPICAGNQDPVSVDHRNEGHRFMEYFDLGNDNRAPLRLDAGE